MTQSLWSVTYNLYMPQVQCIVICNCSYQ